MTDRTELPADLLDVLIDAGNKALNDHYHERACACSTWPEKCASWKTPGDMFFGYWDTDAFAIGLPAIIAAYEQTKTKQTEEPAPCTCAPASRKPHTTDCELTKALATPILCACGDESGAPHPHPAWGDSSQRVLSHAHAYDGRRMEIRQRDKGQQ